MEVYETFLADAERIGIAKSSKLGFANGMLFSSAFFIYGRLLNAISKNLNMLFPKFLE